MSVNFINLKLVIRWEDKSETVASMDWTRMDQWRALVDTVRNLLIP